MFLWNSGTQPEDYKVQQPRKSQSSAMKTSNPTFKRSLKRTSLIKQMYAKADKIFQYILATLYYWITEKIQEMDTNLHHFYMKFSVWMKIQYLYMIYGREWYKLTLFTITGVHINYIRIKTFIIFLSTTISRGNY